MIFTIRMHWKWFFYYKNALENDFYYKNALEKDFYYRNALEDDFIIKMH